ncbi:MAG: AraC family transcriptional regulator [Butyrivibrio sp.]|jgi:AraC-like DNA-binding protein|nr:AraC family transcriptional regulator [Butyrivibrio sp.]
MNANTHLPFFIHMIQTCYPLQFWEYDQNMKLITVPSAKDELLEYFFRFSDAGTYMKTYISNTPSLPMILSSRAGLLWSAVFTFEKDLPHIHIMGPTFVNGDARQSLRHQIQSGRQPQSIRRHLITDIERIPILPSIDLFQYTIMFHYTLTGQRITVSDIQYPTSESALHATTYAEWDKKNEQEDFPGKNGSDHRGVSEIDRQLLDTIRTGNLHYEDVLAEAAKYSTGIKGGNMDSIRRAKNSIILFNGLCSRAAIDGGLPAEISYNLCDMYTGLIENSTAMTELMQISHTMYDDYVHRVHDYHQTEPLSLPVRFCCDYIRMHVEDDITLLLLSSKTGYQGYYLSRRFKTETGMSLSEFITKEKTDYAERLLRTTAQPVQEISDLLHFSSPGYFITQFKKYKGVTPGQLRK